MGIDVRSNVVFPKLGAPSNAEVALGQREEGGMLVLSTISAELEETPSLPPLSQLLMLLGSNSFNIGCLP